MMECSLKLMEGGFEGRRRSINGEEINNRNNDLNITIREIMETKEIKSSDDDDDDDDDDDLNMTISEILEMNSSLRYEEIDHELKEMKNFIEDVPSKRVEPEEELGFQAEEFQNDSFSVGGRHEGTPVMPSSPPPASLIAQFSMLDSDVDAFGLVSGAGMEFDRASDLLVSISAGTVENKQKIAQLSFAAMEELQNMAKEKQPLWQEFMDGEALSPIEYTQQFRQIDRTMRKTKEALLFPNLCSLRHLSVMDEESPAPPLHAESSRHTRFLAVDPVHIVELLMDMNQYSTVFSNIVSRATVLANLSTKALGNYDGALQVIAVEFNAPSPLLPTRQCNLARHSKQLAAGKWGVVDVSLENLFPNPLIRYRRRPSGCIFEQLQDGVTKIVWVEHSEADDSTVPEIFKALVASGHVYSAGHWLGTLARQCERLGHIMARTDPKPGGIVSPGRENVLRLAERMMRKFWANLSNSAENIWRPVPLKGAENVKAMIRNGEDDEEGQLPAGTISVVIATTVWVPASPRRVFDFLRNERTRNMWDILTSGHHVRETGHIDNGCDHQNRVSILEVKSREDKIVVILLQESYSTATGSYVTFAPVEACVLDNILNGGGSPEQVPILPSGFSVLPDGGSTSGSLVTMAFQMLDGASSATYIPPDSVATIFKLIMETAECIKAACSVY